MNTFSGAGFVGIQIEPLKDRELTIEIEYQKTRVYRRSKY